MDVIKELKQKPLVDFFETHLSIPLIKRGNKYCCTCPIHSETNPSFFIDATKNKCSCYGSCGMINGDIIDFTTKYKSFSINESIHWLAAKYKIPHIHRNDNVGATEQNNEYYEICNFASNYYASGLLFKKSYTRLGIEYIRSRKLVRGVVRNFNLGYAPNTSEIGTWTFLTDVLKQKGYSLDLCEQIGLIRKSRYNNYYDAFIGRIMFPIYDTHDKCLGFNSRILPEYQSPENNIPKYLLSKENSIFKKSNFIYGLNNSLRYIRQQDTCYIVEGCFDCYRMWEFDYKNTVPLLGGKLFRNTALQNKTSDGKFSFTDYFCGLPDVSTYIFLMDPDKAGIKYSLENGAELIKYGKNVLICELNKDPSDCDQNEIEIGIEHAKTYIDFYLKHNYKYETSEHKLQILDRLCNLMNGISKEQVVLYAIELEEKLKVPLNLILFKFKIEDKINYGEIFESVQNKIIPTTANNTLDLDGDIW